MDIRDRLEDMSRDEKRDILLGVLQDETGDWLGSRLVLDDDNDELFVILEDWSDLSIINERLNVRLANDALEEWRSVYENIEDPIGGAFADMRLGNNATVPYNRVPLYLIPEGLIDLDMICESGFSDQYDACSECNRLIRTAADSYCWQADYDLTDDGIFCKGCIDHEEYIETRINRNRLVNGHLVNPADHGFTEQSDEYEAGLHPHMNDKPAEQIERYNEQNLDVVFTGAPSQFYVSYTVWTRPEEYEVD